MIILTQTQNTSKKIIFRVVVRKELADCKQMFLNKIQKKEIA
jgi:hypothetical protein